MSLFPHERPRTPKGDGPRKLLIQPDRIHDLSATVNDEIPPPRVNLKAAIILGVLAILLPIAYLALSSAQDGRLQRVSLEQARAFAAEGKIDLALITLEHHFASWPDDLEGLELQAEWLTDSAQTPDMIIRAANVQDQLLRIDPMGKGRQENRRKLVELYLLYGEWLRYTSTKKELWIDRFQSRYRAAVKIAQQRIIFGGDDADSHRLMGIALEGLASMGDSKSQAEAAIEYEKTLRRDPGDLVAAEHLALIDLERRKDAAGGDEILDELMKARPASAQVRLIRYRFARKTKRDQKASAELLAATKLAPTDVDVRLAAAGDSLRRNDIASARRNLDAIPRQDQGKPRVIGLRGQLALNDGKLDEAIETWRKGLAASGGRDRELTWQLANTLIRQGRNAEAIPLVDRYGKLAGDDSNPISCMLRGTLKERTGQPAAAIAELEAARATVSPEMVTDLAMTLGRCYESINEDLKAVVEYRRAQDASPLSSYPRRSSARIVAKSDPELAARDLAEGARVVTDPVPLLLDLAAIRCSQQRALPPEKRSWDEVDGLLDRVEKLAPGDLELTRLRAEVMAATGRTDEAFDLMARTARGPAKGREGFWLAWASALTARGRVAEALRVLEEGSAPSAAGDHSSLRAARAKLLARSGHARAARDLLRDDAENLPGFERANLARARAEILHDLGDQAGARDACRAWSKLSPGDPQPGLALLAMAQQGGGDEAARLGLAMLREVGGQNEPYSLAARAFDLLLSTRAREETRTARREEASRLVESLQAIAPQLPVYQVLRGMMLERDHKLEDAINAYRIALRGNARGMALPRLVALYTELKRYVDLAELREFSGDPALIDQLAAAASLESGDKDRAEKLVDQLVENQPDSLEMRAAQVRLLGEIGKPEKAEESLRSLARRRPDQAGPWLALLIVQLAQKQTEQAARTVDQAAASYKGERPDVLLARCRWIVGQKDAAAKLLESALRARPTDLVTMKEADEFFEANGQLGRAEVILRGALKVDPTSSWASRRLALLLAGRPDRASWAEAWSLVAPGGSSSGDGPEDRMARASILQTCPDPARRSEAGPALLALAEDLPAGHPIGIEARARLARSALDANRPAEAAALIAPTVDDMAAPEPARLALATEALARAGRGDDAGRQLARLLAIEPSSPRAVASRAWVFTATGKKDDAAAIIEDAIAEAEGKPEEATASVAYFDLLARLGQPEAAERVALRIAERRPRDAWLLGLLRAGQGRIADALEAAAASVEAGGDRETMQLILGLASSRKLDPAQLDRAGKLADRVLASAPNDLGLLGMVTALRHFQGRYDDEIVLLRRSLALDPTAALFLNDMAWVLSEYLGQPEEALTRVDEAIRIGGRLPQFSDTRGVILSRLGRGDEAIAELREAVKGRPSGSFYFHLARACRKAGRADLFRDYRDLARKAGVDPARLDEAERAEFASIMGP